MKSKGHVTILKDQEYLTTKQVAQFLQVTEGHVRNMASRGELKYYKLFNLNRYLRSDVEKLIVENSFFNDQLRH